MPPRPLLLVLALPACTGLDLDKTTDTNDTFGSTGDECGDPGPLEIQEVEVVCDGNTVRFSMETRALTGDGRVFFQETGSQFGAQWAENHTLLSYEFDVFGCYDRLERFLQDGDTLADPINDRETDKSTVFQCDAHLEDNAWMAFAFGAYDQQGALADCLAFGQDTQGLINGDYVDENVGESPDFNLAACREGEEAR